MPKSSPKSPATPFPRPDRSNFTPNQFVNDRDMPEGDLGYCEGELADGRPYRMESWYSFGATLVTLFFSTRGLARAKADQLLALVGSVLEEARVPVEYRNISPGEIKRLRDASNNMMFSLSFVVAKSE